MNGYLIVRRVDIADGNITSFGGDVVPADELVVRCLSAVRAPSFLAPVYGVLP